VASRYIGVERNQQLVAVEPVGPVAIAPQRPVDVQNDVLQPRLDTFAHHPDDAADDHRPAASPADLDVAVDRADQPVKPIDGAAHEVHVGEGSTLAQRCDLVLCVGQHGVDHRAHVGALQADFGVRAHNADRRRRQPARHRHLPRRRLHHQREDLRVAARYGLQCRCQSRLVVAVGGAPENQRLLNKVTATDCFQHEGQAAKLLVAAELRLEALFVLKTARPALQRVARPGQQIGKQSFQRLPGRRIPVVGLRVNQLGSEVPDDPRPDVVGVFAPDGAIEFELDGALDKHRIDNAEKWPDQRERGRKQALSWRRFGASATGWDNPPKLSLPW
jgi:hypothetical protein